MSQVSVTINGKTYRMACDAGQENHLIGLAQKLDGYVGSLKDSFGEIGDQRLTVMAGIMVVDELSELKKKMTTMEEDLKELRSSKDAVELSSGEQEKKVLKGLGDAADRIESLAKRLSGA